MLKYVNEPENGITPSIKVYTQNKEKGSRNNDH